MKNMWTREQIEKWVKKNRRLLGYQKIELPYGCTTYDHIQDPRNFKDKLEDIDWNSFKEKTVLDVGCNIGYYCLKAHRKGAKHVLGIDGDSKKICCANDIRDMWNYKGLFFKEGRIEDVSRFGQFDVVICLSVYHHLDNVFRPISELAQSVKAGGTLFFEAVCPNVDKKEHVLYLQQKCNSKKEIFRIAFYPTVSTMIWILEIFFSDVKCLGPSVKNDKMSKYTFVAKEKK